LLINGETINLLVISRAIIWRSPKVILLAKSGRRTIDVQQEPENQVCQRTHACETDFASSIKSAQEPESRGHVWILEGWQLDPERVRAVTRPHLRACWLLVDEAALEARVRADTAFYQGCTDVERFIRHDMARSRWVNDRVRRAAAYEAGVVLHVGPEDTGDAVVTRCIQRVWPG
jgi:hypothetical protein